MKHKRSLAAALALSISAAAMGLSPAVFAAVSAEKASQLGGDQLTPVGAERAGNAAGTIPAWTGGLNPKTTPYAKGSYHADPFADDQPLFIINASNMDQYAANLTEGQKELLSQYGDSWYMRIYPTRRSASYPDMVYQAFKDNAIKAEVDLKDRGGVNNASISSPFPIPQNGAEVVWNHNLRWRGVGVHRFQGEAAVTSLRNNYKLVAFEEELSFPHGDPDPDSIMRKRLPHISVALKQKVIAPGLFTGRGQLVVESKNYNKVLRATWIYSPNLRRVFRTPFSGFDNPAPLSSGLRFNDEADMFNGTPGVFNWTLLGKKEIYIPYNAYQLHSGELSDKDIVQDSHINPELARYELHRVWVVEGLVKHKQRDPAALGDLSKRGHSYSKRVFYVDEDSWQIALADNYDKDGKLWRTSEGHMINYYQMPLPWYTLETYYDLQQKRYMVSGLDNRLEPPEFFDSVNPRKFSPNSLHYYVR